MGHHTEISASTQGDAPNGNAVVQLSARDVLVKARALLVERGWIKGQFVDDRGCCCMMGACYIAAGALAFVDDDGLWDVGPADIPEGTFGTLRAATGRPGIASFNDAPDRTLGDVLAAFDRAIASLPDAPLSLGAGK